MSARGIVCGAVGFAVSVVDVELIMAGADCVATLPGQRAVDLVRASFADGVSVVGIVVSWRSPCGEADCVCSAIKRIVRVVTCGRQFCGEQLRVLSVGLQCEARAGSYTYARCLSWR